MNAPWVQGRADGLVRADDRGFTLGDGVFDTLVAFDGAPILGERHLARLVAQAEAIGIAADPARIAEGWRAVLAEAGPRHRILRTTLSRGSGPRGLWPEGGGGERPTLVVATAPWDAGLAGRPARLVTADQRRNETAPSSRLKSLGYLDHVLAARDAAAAGATDALFLNTAGLVACTTIANLFAIRDDELVTPPESDGVMPGVIRGLVLELAAAVGLRRREASIAADDLRRADLVFLTNSVRLLSRVESLDGAALSEAGEPALAALRAALAARLGAAVFETGSTP